jgi:type IV secretory pathway VirB4 component
VTKPRVRAHQLTTAHLQAAYPFMAEGGLGGRGVLVGRDVYAGGSFCYDPWVLYEDGVITGPSAVIAGQVGLGKSALVKTYLARQLVFGRRAVIVDPKGEYERLAAWFDTAPILLKPRGGVRLNPLDPRVGREGHLALLGTILAASLGRALEPPEHAAIDLALTRASAAGTPTLPVVQRHLLAPDKGSADTVSSTVSELAADGRACALELRRLCEGDLAGMFDGETSAAVDLDAPVVVFDMRSVLNSPALGILMTCVAAWLEGQLRAGDNHKRIVVLDEAWALVADLATAAFLQRSWKLARTYGVQNILVMHRLSDLTAAGDHGSRLARIAEGLLSDSETRILLRQSPADLGRTRQLIGLTGAEVEHVATLPRATALWRVGNRSFVVEHRISRDEHWLIDTDAAMRTADAEAA